ncbi:MAG: GspH/FimT family pseudopilin [Gammaproteobacteria bacterium]|nr:GspH/FimT family pseudopilin [Gammaproteobacteria bacterium]
MHRKAAGFTLIELIIVIIIMSILATKAYFNWSSATINLASQANQIAADLRYAQTLSMTTGQRYRFVKMSSTTYQILNSAGTAIQLTSGGTTATLSSGITFGTLTNLPNNLVAFDGKGVPYTDTGSPGTALASTAVINLSAGSNTTTVSIVPETGRVTAP